ncbi:hypothetical protein BJY01DRAFT_195751 [Aspergillus pseudoustus]|uniref:Uncharacterized protein n=1 Tax=Aspergillus pseudoustus TaxID=1810923 RepID=A0ABR4KUE0_9EURO
MATPTDVPPSRKRHRYHSCHRHRMTHFYLFSSSFTSSNCYSCVLFSKPAFLIYDWVIDFLSFAAWVGKIVASKRSRLFFARHGLGLISSWVTLYYIDTVRCYDVLHDYSVFSMIQFALGQQSLGSKARKGSS